MRLLSRRQDVNGSSLRLFITCAVCAGAVKFEDRRNQTATPPRFERASRSDFGASDDATHLPELAEFKQLWEAHDAKDKQHRGDHFPNDVHLVLGVPVYDAEFEFRPIVESSWWKQPGVCNLLDADGRAVGKQPDCSVYVLWIVGLAGDGQGERNTLHLNMSDSSCNSGMSYVFMNWAVHAAPWATHIGKCDIDAYPFLHQLSTSLSQGSQHGRYQVYGKCMHADVAEWPKDGRYRGEPCHCTQWCCQYWQGGLYVLGRSLAQAVTEKGGYWDVHKKGYEDMNLGRTIRKWSYDTGECFTHFPMHPEELDFTHLR